MQYVRIAGPPADLAAPARIRGSALRLFAERGYAATSIRAIAEAAGVSPGLVQHHFRSKEALRRAVDDEVLGRVAGLMDEAIAEAPLAEAADRFGVQTIRAMERQPELVAYLRRGMVDGEPAGLRLFDGLVSIAKAQVERLADVGEVRPGSDLQWVALHVVLTDLVVMLLEEAINRQLDHPILSREGLERWQRATSQLFTHGFFHEHDEH